VSFRDAVEQAVAPIPDAFMPGKQALGNHADRVECKSSRRFTGSIALDEALKKVPVHARAHRWDYGMGYRPPQGPESAVWVEVHSANTSEVDSVIRKLAWLQDFLRQSCPLLWQLTHPPRIAEGHFIWVASGTVAIPSHTRQYRRLATSGLSGPMKKLRLP
jgi:hypothetical protein